MVLMKQKIHWVFLRNKKIYIIDYFLKKWHLQMFSGKNKVSSSI